MKRLIVNSITLVRVPVIVLLASASTDLPRLALELLAIGMLSHALDGTIAARLGLKTKHSGYWHEMDTVYLSLGLQLAAAVWLIRADVFPWWVIPIYIVVTTLLEFGYVEPRKKAYLPFFPIVLIGSGVVWMALAVLIAAQEGGGLVVAAIVFPVLLAMLHATLHGEQWNYWGDENSGNRRTSRGW